MGNTKKYFLIDQRNILLRSKLLVIGYLVIWA